MKYRRGWAAKKVGVGHHVCAHEKGRVKKGHATHWGWVVNNYASNLSIAGMYTYKI